MKRDVIYIAAWEHVAVDSFEVICDDVFVSFRGYLGSNLADVSFKVF